MKSAGVPTNASRIYLYLLRHAPATGYEISQRAGVTRSAIKAIMTNQDVVIAAALNQLVLDITLVDKQQDRSVQDVINRTLSG